MLYNWNLLFAVILFYVKVRLAATQVPCRVPSFLGNTYSVLDSAPNGAIARVTVSIKTQVISGWSVVVIFSSPLDENSVLRSFSTELTGVSADRRAFTFSSLPFNENVVNTQQLAFVIILSGANVTGNPQFYTALVGFYDTRVQDGSCFLSPNPMTPLSSKTPPTTTFTRILPTTTRKPTTVPSTTPTTTTQTSSTTLSRQPTAPPVIIPNGCERISYISENKWFSNGWRFVFRYRSAPKNYVDWTIKIVFSEEVTHMKTYQAVSEGPYNDNRVWFLKPKKWNRIMNRQHDNTGQCVMKTSEMPKAIAIVCNNNVKPDTSLISIPGVKPTTAPITTQSTTSISTLTTSTTTKRTSTTTKRTTTTTAAQTSSTFVPPTIRGVLPNVAAQTRPNFKPSSAHDKNLSPYDYNEILHKSILFYEAQRSGKLPANNRIPWRGDSGLADGCAGGTECVDLVGGWYDAGDFVKFGFPMSWSITVLAWGMIEFRDAYQDAGEWERALDMLKWGVDYLLKAHIKPNELYVQVGNPYADHGSWGHPETLKMNRPAFKIDKTKPGSDVAGETAAAFAASSIVFRDSNSQYSDDLLIHAKELLDFAMNYRGNYHDSLPESKVGDFYRSFNGYEDELMWASMWMYKATGDTSFAEYAEDRLNLLNPGSFSWDEKSPGVLVLLCQKNGNGRAKEKLLNGLNRVMQKKRTPGGLTYFSSWGPNRYAANYALVALLTAKLEGFETPLGRSYYGYGKEQIHKMLGDGDNRRSYVVGYGVNPPERPHHRASSCRLWSTNPVSRICEWTDKDSDNSNPLTLFGALVGGPDVQGRYYDDRSDYIANEVALDYNAGFQSAIAALKHFLMLQRS